MQLDHCPPLAEEMAAIALVKQTIATKAVERAKLEGLHKHARLNDPTDHYYNNLEEYAVFKCAYYMCFKCKSPYFGGLNDCGDE